MEVNAGTELQSFSNRFNSEHACMEALIAMKWPNGFVCPRCAHTRCSHLTSRHIPLFECGKCKHQTSALVGTIFEGTHLPLLKWFDARELLCGDVKVNSDLYGRDPSRCQLSNPYATAVIAGCTVTESGEPEQVKIRLVPHKRGDGQRADRHELAAFINGHVDARISAVQSFPLAFRLYAPLRKVVREAWEALKSTYGALGLKHLQAYLNEYTGRRQLHLPEAKETMRQKLLRMCVAIPAIPYRLLIARQPNQPLAAAA
ncbi:transposase [Paenibacillus macerans]|uniref:transposase n=1 Tax=Paenibacillus macerans TaxID=44252 RepID=UPI00203AABD0|nr:transposase [Paenibacillus macerans]MCM3700072.1 transposase [Paenibacillus macerans]